jgi:hypothetical protein
MISINIWDDYSETDESPNTFMYIESRTPEDKPRLEYLLDWLNKNYSGNSKFSLQLYDSKKKYPELVGTEHEWCLFHRWEIKIENLPHPDRHKLMQWLNDTKLTYNNEPFEFFSES